VFVKIFIILVIAWPVSEAVLGVFLRARRDSARVEDRSSLAYLWITIAAALIAANLIRVTGVGRIGLRPEVFLSAGSIIIVAGLALRWMAIITLGRFFTANVAVLPGHSVVRTGVYRRIRHPSYSGLLLAFAGAGVAFDNWLSLLAIIVPITTALLYRIRVEEAALLEILGSEYADYRKVTKRLIPGVY
jgi:protein-S-isoprenylcysteine O-methyltransferase Ste14